MSASGFKIFRDGDIVFLLARGFGNAINVKQISRILAEDYYVSVAGNCHYTIWTGGKDSLCIELSQEEARQLLMDTPWVRVIPPRKP